MSHYKFLLEAVTLSRHAIDTASGGPFGCVIVKDGKIIGRGQNCVTSASDPTAHAEVMAIRDACKNLNTFQLTDCDIYTSCEPCPMCFGAIYWARPRAVYYANDRYQAADTGFDDEMIYQELAAKTEERSIKMTHVPIVEAMAVFEEWKKQIDKTVY